MPGATRRVLLALAAALLLLVALRVHGFSLAMWHQGIDGSAAPELLFGEPRAVRTDDWALVLPLAFAQAAHTPAFPRVNGDLGLGQDLALPIPVPIAYPYIAFRPSLWGFFAGRDLGMSWMWWSRIGGFLAVWLLVFQRLAPGRLALPAAGCALLLFSPHFQFWSYNPTPLVAFAGAAFLLGDRLLGARSPARLAGLAVGLAAAVMGCLMVLYPPYQVVTAQLVAVLLAARWVERRRELGPPAAWRGRGLALAGSGLLFAACAGAFWLETREALATLLASEYPGQREARGSLSLARLFSSNLGLALQLDVDAYGRVGDNICEASGFWLFFPAIGAQLLWRRGARGERLDPVCAGLLLYAGALAVWASLGLPGWLAAATGLSWVPAERAKLGIGLADAALVVRYLALPRGRDAGRDRSAWLVAAAFAAGLAACVPGLRAAYPGASLPGLLPFAALNGVAALALLQRWRPAVCVSLLAATLAACTLWFNPVAVGGSRFLLENPLSQRIRAEDAAAEGRSVWAVYRSGRLADLLRVLGVRCLNGTHTLPQLELWSRFDPAGRQRQVYNRYGLSLLEWAPPGEARFRRIWQGIFELRVHPESPPLRELGVTHLLTSGDRRVFDGLASFEHVASLSGRHIYRRRGPSGAADASAPSGASGAPFAPGSR